MIREVEEGIWSRGKIWEKVRGVEKRGQGPLRGFDFDVCGFF